MKNFILLFVLTLFAAFASSVIDTVDAQTLLYTGEMGPDTVNASETITHWPNGTSFATARRFTVPGDMIISCKLDSLSGTPNVKSILWVADDLAGTIWVPVDTVTSVLMGATKTFQFDTWNVDDSKLFKATWFKITHTGTGTQAVKAQDTYAFKKRL